MSTTGYTIGGDGSNVNLTTGEGGIFLNAGLGGVQIDTSNAFLVNANAESGLTTTMGNIVFNAAGNFQANSTNTGTGGIAIADNAVDQMVNVGTGLASKTITIGNSTGATTVGLVSGSSGNLTLSANGTGPGALTLAATQPGGGIDMDAGTGGARLDSPGQIVLSSTRAVGNDVLLDAPNGCVALSSGAMGIAISTTGTLFLRHSLFSTHVRTQTTETSLADADASLTMAQLLTKVLVGTPTTVDRTLTSPTAAQAVAGLGGVAVNDAIDFSIVNDDGTVNWILAAGTGVTTLGGRTISTNSSGLFRLTFRNVTASSEAVTIVRLA